MAQVKQKYLCLRIQKWNVESAWSVQEGRCFSCMKNCLFVALVLVVTQFHCRADSRPPYNCGINSVVSLARVLGSKGDMANALQAKYPSSTVSLLDVKRMCEQAGIKAAGVKSTLSQLLSAGNPSIIALKNPDHFTVMLDGQGDDVRIIEGEEGELEVVPRKEVQARFAGFALTPQLTSGEKGPRLQAVNLDQFKIFEATGQKVDYRFPVSNSGDALLEIEIARTSCGCTGARIEGDAKRKVVLLRNETATIVVSYTVQAQGQVQQVVTLKTTDPLRREVYLSVRGQLPPRIALSPPSLYAQAVYRQETNRKFKVIGPTGTKIAQMSSDLPFLICKVAAEETDEDRIALIVSVSGFKDAPPGRIDGKIFVMLEDGTKMYLPVRGAIETKALLGNEEALTLPRAENDPRAEIAHAAPKTGEGQAAPDFAVLDMDGKMWRASQLNGKKNLLLTFFPKCFTGGCANHLSSLRDRQAAFDATETQILAVSVDPADGEKGQKAFAAQWKLSFPLIPDVDRKLSMLYGAAQNDRQLAARMSILIDKNGIVRWVDTHVNVQTHGADVLAKMRELGLTQ